MERVIISEISNAINALELLTTRILTLLMQIRGNANRRVHTNRPRRNQNHANRNRRNTNRGNTQNANRRNDNERNVNNRNGNQRIANQMNVNQRNTNQVHGQNRNNCVGNNHQNENMIIENTRRIAQSSNVNNAQRQEHPTFTFSQPILIRERATRELIVVTDDESILSDEERF